MMVLYSGTTCPFSQRCRLVLFEKGMDFEVRDVDLFNKPEDISTMNPYGQYLSWLSVTSFCMSQTSSTNTSTNAFRIRN